MPNGTQAVAGAIVPLFATGVVAYQGRAIMAGANKKKKNKKAHLENHQKPKGSMKLNNQRLSKLKRSKGRHKLREMM